MASAPKPKQIDLRPYIEQAKKLLTVSAQNLVRYDVPRAEINRVVREAIENTKF